MIANSLIIMKYIRRQRTVKQTANFNQTTEQKNFTSPDGINKTTIHLPSLQARLQSETIFLELQVIYFIIIANIHSVVELMCEFCYYTNEIYNIYIDK